ncbi:hypothetical protein DCAR_0414925 [Daucus carota subsp. sativus]|uniref:Bet v I/Major latex protein domain-containing protein n=1 Tax=Daucus carota subsp. sativus TaxID=79200 RepID=A0AAF0WT71_DAUCS|nr:hypothetical protein DCAR_0414925 [Daucus carota subsp. sativus]
MGLIGKLICQTSINKPHRMAPDIQGCDLHEGEFGKVGSIIIWKYTEWYQRIVKSELISTKES